jgi:uncharacterized protein YegP (UPF0339 family)
MQFLVFEDNGGGYIWTIVAEDGKRLAQSGSFASHDDAVTAARVVRDGAGSAGLDGFDEDRPVDLAARRQSASARDGLDPERWLDEGGKPNSRAAAALPARP